MPGLEDGATNVEPGDKFSLKSVKKGTHCLGLQWGDISRLFGAPS